MTTRRDGGGPAFPTCVSADNMGGLNYGQPGMDLRDYFAAVALRDVLAYWTRPEPLSYEHEDVLLLAENAYRIADAMLIARAKK